MYTHYYYYIVLQLKPKELYSKNALLCDCTYDYLVLIQYLINKQQILYNTDVSLLIYSNLYLFIFLIFLLFIIFRIFGSIST